MGVLGGGFLTKNGNFLAAVAGPPEGQAGETRRLGALRILLRAVARSAPLRHRPDGLARPCPAHPARALVATPPACWLLWHSDDALRARRKYLAPPPEVFGV